MARFRCTAIGRPNARCQAKSSILRLSAGLSRSAIGSVNSRFILSAHLDEQISVDAKRDRSLVLRATKELNF